MKIKNKQLFSFLILVGILWSCEKEIPYTGDDSDSLLVINQIIEKDSTFSVGIERSKFFLENTTTNPILNNATIVLRNATSGISETQTVGSNGLYDFSMIAEEGHSYEITASHPDYPSASANTMIPSAVSLVSADTMTFFDPEQGNIMRAKLKWNDPVGKNYYIVSVTIDNPFYTENAYMNSDDVSITNGGTDFEGGLKYGQFFSLNDESFDGTQKELDLEFGNFIDPSNPNQYTFKLFSCTEDTYRYLVSVNLNNNSGGGPFTEPVKVHSNIEGGYGIFGGLNKSQIIK